MAEIKDKTTLPGGVEITSSSDFHVRGIYEQVAASVAGTNGVVLDLNAESPTKNTAVGSTTLKVQSPATYEPPLTSSLTVVESFSQNPSGLGHVLRMTRVRDQQRLHQLKKAA